jgi:hypothetical protein
MLVLGGGLFHAHKKDGCCHFGGMHQAVESRLRPCEVPGKELASKMVCDKSV